jgi:hypothetical protein
MPPGVQVPTLYFPPSKNAIAHRGKWHTAYTREAGVLQLLAHHMVVHDP